MMRARGARCSSSSLALSRPPLHSLCLLHPHRWQSLVLAFSAVPRKPRRAAAAAADSGPSKPPPGREGKAPSIAAISLLWGEGGVARLVGSLWVSVPKRERYDPAAGGRGGGRGRRLRRRSSTRCGRSLEVRSARSLSLSLEGPPSSPGLGTPARARRRWGAALPFLAGRRSPRAIDGPQEPDRRAAARVVFEVRDAPRSGRA